MLDRDTRTAILKLHDKGHGIRPIARAVGVSRKSVRKVLEEGSPEVPSIFRPQRAEPYLDAIRELYAECKGNLVRVQEELEARHNFDVAYSTLTAFCRRHEIGVVPKTPSGRYHFDPGEEMQHDTSPHTVKVGGKLRGLQCASLVLCYSRMVFLQVYPTFNRFYAKVFLTDGVLYFGGAADRCMVDNTNVVIAHGTGKDAVVAPEMEAFADRFDFHFEAHEKGDANRSARVERRFHYIENNFYPGRSFVDLADLNAQLRAWCRKVNTTYRRYLKARPTELFVVETPKLKPLPIYVPEVYRVHERIVDLEGYVTLHNNRYSVPVDMIGRRVEVRESKDAVRISRGHRLVAEHVRLEEGESKQSTIAGHHPRRSKRQEGSAGPPLPEEPVLEAASPNLAALVAHLREHYGRRRPKHVRRLHRMYLDYPLEPLDKAVAEAIAFGLYDLPRIERMVLRYVAGDFFRLPLTDLNDDTEDDDDG
jgi:transposase